MYVRNGMISVEMCRNLRDAAISDASKKFCAFSCSRRHLAKLLCRTVWSRNVLEQRGLRGEFFEQCGHMCCCNLRTDVVRIRGSRQFSWTRKLEARLQQIGFVAGQVGSGRDKIVIDPSAMLVQTCLCLCLSFRFLGATDKHTWRVCTLNVHAAPSCYARIL